MIKILHQVSQIMIHLNSLQFGLSFRRNHSGKYISFRGPQPHIPHNTVPRRILRLLPRNASNQCVQTYFSPYGKNIMHLVEKKVAKQATLWGLLAKWFNIKPCSFGVFYKALHIFRFPLGRNTNLSSISKE